MLGLPRPAQLSRFEPTAGSSFDPAAYARHALHDPERDWPQTNCYVDLWIELIASLGLAPEAMLGFTLAQDFEGDQFTFFKPPLGDLETLYGLRVDELALYEATEPHISRQLDLGRVVLIEVDGYFLPDTRGVTYRLEHSKTTIGVLRLDADDQRLVYFHNDGLFELRDEDFVGVLGLAPGQKRDDMLFPYAEFVRFDRLRVKPPDLRELAEELLRAHYERRPLDNPLRAFSARFEMLWGVIEQKPEGFFHKFAFNTLRQLGANFELLASHLDWLRPGGAFAAEAGECRRISASAKALQFQVARAAARRRPLAPHDLIEEMALSYDRLIGGLAHALDR